MPTFMRELHQFTQAIDALREEDETMPVQTARILLGIALEPGITVAQLKKDVGLSQAAVARHVAYLGEWYKLGKPGLNLVEKVADPIEPRRQIMFLSAKGRRRVSRVLSALLNRDVTFDGPSASEHIRDVHAKALKDT